MRRADRLFQIVQHLRARRLTTAGHLARQLGVSERTVYRDIRDLSLSGIPIQGEAGVGYQLDRGFELTALMFTRDEVEAVVVGLRMAAAFGGPVLRRAAEPALNKVILALPKERRDETGQAAMHVPPIQSGKPVEERLEQLRLAISARAVLEIEYLDLKERSSRRRVRPLGLYFWGSVWTLAAWCESRRDLRTFRIDRIAGAALTGEHFREEPGKSLADYLARVERDRPQ